MSCKTVAGRRAAKQNTQKSHHVLCNILTGILNSSIIYFQWKLLLQTESCTVQSVKVYFQNSLITILSKTTNVSCACSEWHFLMEWSFHYTKYVIRELIDSLCRDGTDMQYMQYSKQKPYNFATNTLKAYLNAQAPLWVPLWSASGQKSRRRQLNMRDWLSSPGLKCFMSSYS